MLRATGHARMVSLQQERERRSDERGAWSPARKKIVIEHRPSNPIGKIFFRMFHKSSSFTSTILLIFAILNCCSFSHCCMLNQFSPSRAARLACSHRCSVPPGRAQREPHAQGYPGFKKFFNKSSFLTFCFVLFPKP